MPKDYTTKEKLNDFLTGLFSAAVLVFVMWGVYLTVTPLDYCDYKLCIKIGEK